MRYGILASLLLIPSFSNAAVMLSEIAWMGTTVGPNEEWIELYNYGPESVPVNGWTLSDNNSLTIALTGTIPANSFVLLERSDDGTVPGVAAFLTYTGALPNTGATMTLRNAEGAVVDSVVGGENWQNIGGDNATKQTPQRTTTSWTTGVPTPGAANVVHEQPAPEDEEENVPRGEVKGIATTQKNDGPNTRISLTPSTNELDLAILGKEISYVNHPVTFAASTKGVGETIQNSLKYAWNFGDTYIGSGKTTTHAYSYPGTYVVALNATYARHDVTVYKTIEVLPVTLSLSRTSGGDVVIKNDADHDIDLSGHTLKGTKEVVFPKNTILLSGGMITIGKDRLEGSFSRGNTLVLDAENVIVASEFSSPARLTITPPSNVSPMSLVTKIKAPIRPVAEPLVLGESDTTRENEDAEPGTISKEEQRIIPVYAQESDQDEEFPDPTSLLTYLGLVGVLVTGILFLYKRRIP